MVTYGLHLTAENNVKFSTILICEFNFLQEFKLLIFLQHSMCLCNISNERGSLVAVRGCFHG